MRLFVIGVLPALAQGFANRRPLALGLTAASDTHAWGCRVPHGLRITSPHRPGPGRPLPRTADHTSLRFAAGDHAPHG
ncbi:hypothetical protein AF335_17270 [Streptomyces eurocidicus]|uniref:Uncharacterized protein n=1 Tax=Streptomyces eurocidicus TaxID=66423 RepID=A0A2N8NUB8_STREU|nr:hypothetical protein AF335_17270 [Streptomyces eurocidicus]